MGRGYTPWMLVLVLACTLTFHIQLFALFYSGRSSLEDDIYCHSNVEIFFSNDTFQLPKTEDDLVSEWFSVPRSSGRIMANRRATKYYLAVGVAVHHFNQDSIGQHGRSVLERTLQSLVNKTSTYEKLHNFIVVIISQQLNEQSENLLVNAVVRRFLFEINIGFLHIFLPPTTFNMNSLIPGSTCNSSHFQHATSVSAVEEEKTLSIHPCLQLESMLAVWTYCNGLAGNYLHLDDSMEAVHNFVWAVREYIRIQKLNNLNWGILEFSSYNFIGHMVRTHDVVKFVQFFATTQTSNLGNDAAFELFCRLMSQKSRLFRKPEIFQKLTSTSHQQTNLNEGDEEEARWLADDPPGTVYTNMNHIGSHIPSLFYGLKSGYFKTLMPQVGDWIIVVFDDDVSLQKVKIRTGELSVDVPDRRVNTLLRGVLEASPRVLRIDMKQNMVVCADYVKIGDIPNGVAEVSNFSRSLWGRTTRCLKLTVTDADGRDVIFRQIAVYT